VASVKRAVGRIHRGRQLDGDVNRAADSRLGGRGGEIQRRTGRQLGNVVSAAEYSESLIEVSCEAFTDEVLIAPDVSASGRKCARYTLHFDNSSEASQAIGGF
jgi:hypothetical protein